MFHLSATGLIWFLQRCAAPVGSPACRRWRLPPRGSSSLDRGDEKLAPALPRAVEHRLDRRDVALALSAALIDRRDQMAGGRDRWTTDRIDLLAAPLEFRLCASFRKPRIGAHSPRPDLSDGRDRHRGMIEEAHEADFGGALADRAASVAARLITRRARNAPGGAVGAERQLCDRAAPAWSCRRAWRRIDVETPRFSTSPGTRHDRGQQRGAVARGRCSGQF